MSANGLDILKRKFAASINDSRQGYYDEVEREAEKVASRGFSMPTGNLIFRTNELAATRVRNIAKIGIEIINELADRQVLKVDHATKQEILELITAEISREAEALSQYADRRFTKQPITTSARDMILKAAESAKADVDIEIDILINSKTSSEVASVFNIYNYGTANAIQAGNNNTINYAEQEKSEKLIAALTELVQQLKEQEIQSIPNGVTASLEETLIELQLPESEKNPFKIQASLMMAMATLQTLPTLKPAVATLATAYDYYFGTNLSTMFS